jgi:hypothetical protein
MTLKATANRVMLKLFLTIQNIIKNKFNLQVLKKKYNAHGNSVINVRVYNDRFFQDLIFSGNFKLGADTIEKLDNVQKADGMVEMDYQTIIDIAKGTKTREYQGQKQVETYTIMDAFREGRIVITGMTLNEYIGDMMLFEHIYLNALPELRNYINDRI